VVALEDPLSATVAPLPFEADAILPEMLQVETVAVKLMPVWLAPLIVTGWLAGLKVEPLLLGVTVKVPLANPVNE
jgi:hypothetical protein